MVKVIGSLSEFQKEIQGPGLVVVDFYAGGAVIINKVFRLYCFLFLILALRRLVWSLQSNCTHFGTISA